jgi:hypothetical protein
MRPTAIAKRAYGKTKLAGVTKQMMIAKRKSMKPIKDNIEK